MGKTKVIFWFWAHYQDSCLKLNFSTSFCFSLLFLVRFFMFYKFGKTFSKKRERGIKKGKLYLNLKSKLAKKSNERKVKELMLSLSPFFFFDLKFSSRPVFQFLVLWKWSHIIFFARVASLPFSRLNWMYIMAYHLVSHLAGPNCETGKESVKRRCRLTRTYASPCTCLYSVAHWAFSFPPGPAICQYASTRQWQSLPWHATFCSQSNQCHVTALGISIFLSLPHTHFNSLKDEIHFFAILLIIDCNLFLP